MGLFIFYFKNNIIIMLPTTVAYNIADKCIEGIELKVRGMDISGKREMSL